LSLDTTQFNTFVTLVGVLVASLLLIFEVYVRLVKPWINNKENIKKLNIKEQEDTIKKEEALYDGIKRLLENFKESIINNSESSTIKENSEYYLSIGYISDNYKTLLNKILYIYDDMMQFKSASLYILRNEMFKYFCRKSEEINRDNPQLIITYIDITLQPYLNGIKITEQYLKEYHLEFFNDVERQGDLVNINRILNHDNNLSRKHEVVAKYRKKKEKLLQLIDEILISLQPN